MKYIMSTMPNNLYYSYLDSNDQIQTVILDRMKDNSYRSITFPNTITYAVKEGKNFEIVDSKVDMTNELSEMLYHDAYTKYDNLSEYEQRELNEYHSLDYNQIIDMFFGEYVDAINTVSERTVYKTKQLSVLSCKNQAVSNLQRTIKNAEYYIGELNRQLKVVDEHITYRTDKQARLDSQSETPVNNLYRNVSGNVFCYKIIDQNDNIFTTECQSCTHGENKCIVKVIKDDRGFYRYLSCDQADQSYWHCDDKLYVTNIKSALSDVKDKFMFEYNRSMSATKNNLINYRKQLQIWESL